MSLPSSIYSEVARSAKALRNLRKVKLFPRVNTVTLVTYYKDHIKSKEKGMRFIGKAYTFNIWRFSKVTIDLEHNSHLPPPEKTTDDEETEQEEDPVPTPVSIPTYGAYHLQLK